MKEKHEWNTQSHWPFIYKNILDKLNFFQELVLMKLFVELFTPAMGHIDILGVEEFSTINQVIPSVKVG